MIVIRETWYSGSSLTPNNNPTRYSGASQTPNNNPTRYSGSSLTQNNPTRYSGSSLTPNKVWMDEYYDYVIRNEEDLIRHLQYIYDGLVKSQHHPSTGSG